MYQQLEALAIEHIRDLRREAEQERLAASAVRTERPTATKRMAASSLLWAGKRLTNWGNQLQGETRKPAYN